ncbi:hypothetical protein NZ35_16700 [Pseudomonas chlororaphis]|uniref:Uncharacterized protein n=1 Tax=Pseudomonas chlororaphis TaxID=587753 RepID=A0A0A6FGY3_9PSED|nr:hypothetical protein NZ35_16700 [Pseudomonas chlororaphis]
MDVRCGQTGRRLAGLCLKMLSLMLLISTRFAERIDRQLQRMALSEITMPLIRKQLMGGIIPLKIPLVALAIYVH